MPKMPSARDDENYLFGLRSQRIDHFRDWHDRIDMADALIRGEYWVVYPDQQSSGQQPVIMNFADIVPREVAKLADEATPSYKTYARGDSEPMQRDKEVRQVIGAGYFTDYGPWKQQYEMLIMDLIVTGTCFVAAWVDEKQDYPMYTRLDPRFCFPDIYNGTMQDLLVVQPMKLRIADRLWPDLGLRAAKAKDKDDELGDSVEVWDYYGPDRWIKGVALCDTGGTVSSDRGVKILASDAHRLECPPAAMGLLPSPTGQLGGILDQIGPSLIAKNRAIELELEYAHEYVYAPFEAKGVLNSSQPPGPTTIYQHDPTAQGETFMRRVSPAQSSNQLMQLVQYLDQEERGSLAYPQTRQGTVPQSQGSASFVTSTQGQLTSMVAQCQRQTGALQEKLAEVLYGLDVEWLDKEKPLCRAVGRKSMYTPSRDIGKYRKLKVAYGAGAGYDRLNTDVRLQNYYAAGLISGETVLEQTDFVEGAQDELNKREAEEARRILLQRFEGDASIPMDALLATYRYQQEKGGSLIDAALAVQALGQSFTQPGAEQQGVAGVGEAAPPTQEVQGAAPAPSVAPEFAPPPMQQSFPRYAL